MPEHDSASTGADPAAAPPPSPPATGSHAMAAEALKAAQQAAAKLGAEAASVGGAAATTVRTAQAAAAQARAAAPAPPAPAPIELPSFQSPGGASGAGGIDLLADVNLNVKIELGRTRMLVEDVLRLGEGSVVELDKLAGDPVDVFVNDRHVARGEVLVLNDNFCVRINEILSPVGNDGP